MSRRDHHVDDANTALRRVDWRFLLGHAPFERAVVAADAGLEAGVRAVCGDVARLDERVSDGRQVAVLSDPTDDTLRRAHAALGDGGTCWIEWRRPSLGRRGHLRRVEAAGFEVTGRWWRWPPPARAPSAFWVPVDAPGAVAHFQGHRPRARSRWRRLAAPLLRRVWTVARALGLLAPTGVLARTATTPATEFLADELRRGWPTWGLGPPPRTIAFVVLTGGKSPLNKVVLLAFADTDREPRLAVKVARVAEAGEALAREERALREAAATAVPDVATIPRVVFCGQVGDSITLGETPVSGEPLIATLSAKTHAAIAQRVTDVLAALAADADPVAPGRQWDDVVGPAVTAFVDRFGAVVNPGAIAHVERSLRALPALPPVVEHRDCSPWNVLATRDGGLALLDWESAVTAGLPLLDLVYFLTNAACLVEGSLGSGSERTTYARLLDPETHGGALFATCVKRYCDRVGVAPDVAATLRAFTWMVHAPGEVDRIGAGRASTIHHAARRSVFLSFWLEETSRGSTR
jgi:hypothetical protein